MTAKSWAKCKVALGEPSGLDHLPYTKIFTISVHTDWLGLCVKRDDIGSVAQGRQERSPDKREVGGSVHARPTNIDLDGLAQPLESACLARREVCGSIRIAPQRIRRSSLRIFKNGSFIESSL